MPGPFNAAFSQAFDSTLHDWRPGRQNPFTRRNRNMDARVLIAQAMFHLRPIMASFPVEVATPPVSAEFVTKPAYRCYLHSDDGSEDANVAMTPRLEAEKTVAHRENPWSWQVLDQGASQDGEPVKLTVDESQFDFSMYRAVTDITAYSGVTNPVRVYVELWGEASRAGLPLAGSGIATRDDHSSNFNDHRNDLDTAREVLA